VSIKTVNIQTEVVHGFEDVKRVVVEELRFKSRLGIGEDAYTSLKIKKYLLDAIDASNGAVTAVAVAKSATVATTFFAPSGILSALGIGAAVTPVGWAIAAGAFGAGLSVVIGRHFTRGTSDRVTVIPEFINTPLDLLATTLFDLIASLGMKVAAIDGDLDDMEKEYIAEYFSSKWGYDERFIQAGIQEIEERLDTFTLTEVTEKLARFKRKNRDCNYESMSKEILQFVAGVVEADGFIDEREDMAAERIARVFDDANSLATKAGEVYDDLNSTADRLLEKTGSLVSSGVQEASSLGSKVKNFLKKT